MTFLSEPMRAFLTDIVGHPAVYGLVAGVARWALGDKAGGAKALLVYFVTSSFVAWAASLYLVDESLTSGRKTFYIVLFAFVAKDVLMALIGVSARFSHDPLGTIQRIRNAINGVPSPPELVEKEDK